MASMVFSAMRSVVPVDQPLFSVYPPVVAYVDFEGLQTYEARATNIMSCPSSRTYTRYHQVYTFILHIIIYM